MKFSEFLIEAPNPNLIGRTISGKKVTKNTKNEKWDDYYFDCSKRGLTSLEGAPPAVGGIFDCRDNYLTSLAGAPMSVALYFRCSSNQLTSLEGAPRSVGHSFYCDNNQLTSLEGAPRSVGHNFNCSSNQLTSLNGAPASVNGSFDCSSNQLTSLDGVPAYIGGHFDYRDNKLTSLHNIHKIIKETDIAFNIILNPIKSHVLGLLLIRGCPSVELDNREVQYILNKYLPNKGGNQWVMACQTELIEAGFREYAKL